MGRDPENETRNEGGGRRPKRTTPTGSGGNRPVAVSLYAHQIEWVERAVRSLQVAGAERCSRSRVVQEAIECLKDYCERQGFDDEGLERFFRRNQARRRAKQHDMNAE